MRRKKNNEKRENKLSLRLIILEQKLANAGALNCIMRASPPWTNSSDKIRIQYVYWKPGDEGPLNGQKHSREAREGEVRRRRRRNCRSWPRFSADYSNHVGAMMKKSHQILASSTSTTTVTTSTSTTTTTTMTTTTGIRNQFQFDSATGVPGDFLG